MARRSSQSLADAFPVMAEEWHTGKNIGAKPEDVPCFSGRKFWWRCKANPKHIWLSAVQSRTLRKAGCPYCSRKYVSDENRLSTLYPEVAAEWHPTENRFLYSKVEGGWKGPLNRQIPANLLPERNRRLKPSDLSYASNETVVWQCKTNPDHVWKAKVLSRTIGGRGGPFCSHNAVSKDNCLTATQPQIAKQWHPSRNLPVTAKDVTSGSGKKFWWRCFKFADHVWQAQVASVLRSRRTGKTRCPFCSGNKVSHDNSLARVYPEVAKRWHPELNNELTAKDVTQSSNRKVFWQCAKFREHHWQATVTNMVYLASKGKSGCPFCAGKRADSTNSLHTACPKAAKLWHYKLNAPLTPDDVTAGSGKSVWWHCKESANHALKLNVQHMVKNQTEDHRTRCPQCETENSLGRKFPEIAKQLCTKRNENLDAETINPGSHNACWWKCESNKQHVWQEEVRRRVRFFQKGVFCKICSGV